MSELKPCPFCGSGWLYETRRNGYCDETPTMFCNSCKAVVTWEQVEEEGVNDKTKTFVREHWNTRAERTCKFVSSKGAEYPPSCSACGYELGIYDCAWYEDGTYGYEQNYCPNCGAKVIGGNDA